MTEREQRGRSGGKEKSEGGQNRGSREMEMEETEVEKTEREKREDVWKDGGRREKARGRREMPDGATKTQHE